MKEITVYTTRVCPFCIHAKKLLDTIGLKYKDVSLENDLKLRVKLARENGGWRTVPMIFVGDHFVGGFQELQTLQRCGELLPLVEAE